MTKHEEGRGRKARVNNEGNWKKIWSQRSLQEQMNGRRIPKWRVRASTGMDGEKEIKGCDFSPLVRCE